MNLVRYVGNVLHNFISRENVGKLVSWKGRGFNQAVYMQEKFYSSDRELTDGEYHITKIVKRNFPKALNVDVRDISGGCGSMYEVHIESEEFAGKRTVQQHKLVTNALKEEVSKMHGLRIFTSVPS